MSEERNNHNNTRTSNAQSWVGLVLRFIVSAIVISVAAFLTPGFTISGIWNVLIAAAIISVIDYLIFKFAKLDASPFGKGLSGFIVAAIVLYAAQFFVPTMGVTPLGAILGAIVIGLIDMIIPGKTF